MNYAVQVIFSPFDQEADTLVVNTTEAKDLYFVGLVTQSITQKVKRRRSNLVRSIILTKEFADAEVYETLAEAQDAVRQMERINSDFTYRIVETKQYNKRKTSKKTKSESTE